MFTPPASPQPIPRGPADMPDTPSSTTSLTSIARDSLSPEPPSRSVSPSPSPRAKIQRRPRALTTKLSDAEQRQLEKSRIGRRTRLTVLLVPLVLVLIALSTGFTSHPAVLDLLTPFSSKERASWSTVHEPHMHMHARRQTGDITASAPETTATSIVFPSLTSGSASSAPSPSPTQDPAGGAPTIPGSPPVLPTPFPQAFDTTFTSNFSTVGCQQFVQNMTGTEPFRQCRPFSFLSQTSSVFLEQAQSNISALNVEIWGTCNTPLSADQCTANMNWFLGQLPKQCRKDLDDQNETVMQVQAGLQTYGLMRQAACLADQSTDTYCYVLAGINTNPSDLYFYSLPYGIGLPNSTTPSCSACTKSMMALFGAQADSVAGLKQTYNSAASIAAGQCGQDYVQMATAVTGAGVRAWEARGVWVGAVALGLVYLISGAH